MVALALDPAPPKGGESDGAGAAAARPGAPGTALEHLHVDHRLGRTINGASVVEVVEFLILGVE